MAGVPYHAAEGYLARLVKKAKPSSFASKLVRLQVRPLLNVALSGLLQTLVLKEVSIWIDGFKSSSSKALFYTKGLLILRMDKQLHHDIDNLQLQNHLMSPMFQYLQES